MPLTSRLVTRAVLGTPVILTATDWPSDQVRSVSGHPNWRSTCVVARVAKDEGFVSDVEGEPVVVERPRRGGESQRESSNPC